MAPNPVVELNMAVAVSMADGSAAALRIVDQLVARGALPGSYLLPSVRGELLSRLDRRQEAKDALCIASTLATNGRERAVLRRKVAAL